MTVPRIEHVITGLETGGAEMVLEKLLLGAGGQFRHSVTSLSGLGRVGARLRSQGVPVRTLKLTKDIRFVSGVVKLAAAWRRERPALAQTWLYHADLVGGLAGVLARVPVVWNIRQSNLDAEMNKASTLTVVRAAAVLSRWVPAEIVCGSESARAAHLNAGYREDRLKVVPNGIDTDVYRPCESARGDLISELDIPHGSLLVGRIGRFDVQKDHRTFVAAAGRILAAVPQAWFIMAGRDITPENPDLVHWIHEFGLGERISLLGERYDIPRITAALDIAVSSSRGEGFPNIVGEAMSCGVPCVVTKAGDSARIVGDTGRIVPTGDPENLAMGCIEMLRMTDQTRRDLGRRARERVLEHFNVGDMVRRYEELYSTVLA